MSILSLVFAIAAIIALIFSITSFVGASYIAGGVLLIVAVICAVVARGGINSLTI